MSSLWVVLDTNSTVGARRVGRISEDDELAASALEVTVKWPDGKVELVKLSKQYRKLRLDTISALAELDPERFTDELKSSPLIFARGLAENPKVHLRSKDLLDLIADRGQTDRALVEVSWKKHRKSFEALTQVHFKSTTTGSKYHIVGALPLIDLPNAAVHLDDVAASPPAKAFVVGPDSPRRARPRATSEPAGARKRNASLTPAEPVDSAEVPATDLAKILTQRTLPAIDEDELTAWFSSKAPGIAVAEGATRLEQLRSDPKAHSEGLTGFSLLVGRILKRAECRVQAEDFARAFVALRRSVVESDRSRGIEALERAVTELRKPTQFLSKIDRIAFHAALAELPLIEGGVRPRLIASIAKSSMVDIEDAGWWRGFDWSDVLAVSTGPLSLVVTRSEVLMAMVREAADGFARDISTRRSLSGLIGGPRFALEHFTPTQIRLIFERVAENDALFAAWQFEVSAAVEREDLTHRISAAEHEAVAALVAKAHVVSKLEELSEQLSAAHLQLVALQDETAGMTNRERRQVFIDAAKVIAQLAATVDGDGRALGPEELSSKVNSLAERYGLRVSVRRGDSVAFEPSKHNAPGIRPELGEIVNVARVGYTWEDDDEQVVVLRALVTRAGGSEERD
jgi:hypothetical protein